MTVTVADCIKEAKGQFCKARRIYMKKRGWRDKDWYDNWPNVAAEWEAAATK